MNTTSPPPRKHSTCAHRLVDVRRGEAALRPRAGARLIFIDVSICSQADLDQWYHQKLDQLGWVRRWAARRHWEEVTIDIIPIPIAITGKVHARFPEHMLAIGVDPARARLLAQRLVAVVVPGLARIWRQAVRQYIMRTSGHGR